MTPKLKVPGDHDLEWQEAFRIVIVTIGAAAVWLVPDRALLPASQQYQRRCKLMIGSRRPRESYDAAHLHRYSRHRRVRRGPSHRDFTYFATFCAVPPAHPGPGTAPRLPFPSSSHFPECRARAKYAFSVGLRASLLEFLTTKELAALLRVKERKIYELVASGSLPVRRVTGKLLFAREEIDQLLRNTGKPAVSEVAASAAEPQLALPLVIAGGHDPLLEWALRESRSGIAALLDGALDGLDRLARKECLAAGLHVPEPGGWNVSAVERRFGREPWVLVEWARRQRGLIFRKALQHSPGKLPDVRGLRFQLRQLEAASELVLDRLLEDAKLTREDLSPIDSVERTESDLALAISTGRADVGLGIEAAARQYRLEFVPLIEERFDLLIWRKAYFDPPFLRLFAFCRAAAFAERAGVLGGYDVRRFGEVRFNGS